MWPPCSRSRRPSARNRKSNLARSAVRAKWTKELNSMWLPASGSLHTVVLLTPGKCAARWICFSGLLMVLTSPSGSGGGVAVGGAGQAQQSAQGVGLVGAAEGGPALEFGDQAAGDRRKVVAEDGGTQPESAQSGRPPLLEQVGELGGGAGEDAGVAGVRGSGESVE